MFSKTKESSTETPMKKTGSNKAASSIPSIIAPDVTIVGNVQSQGVIQLDGKVEGEIQIKHLTIGNEGWVDGTINADEVTIKGKVTGAINAHQVTLEKSAKVHGDIQHDIISIEAGAVIDGKISQNKEKVTELSTSAKEK